MDDSIMIVNDDESNELLVLSPSSPENPVVAVYTSPRATRASLNAANSPAPPHGSPLGLSSIKKRKRAILTPSPKTLKSEQTKPPPLLDDDDDGATCPICLDHWEMSGDHRLTSLKCGHLFGQSCIRRWLQECATGAKCCPSCKAKATARDFRYLYAKKLCVLDNSEAETLKVLLEEKRADVLRLTHEKNVVDFELQRHRERLNQLQEQNDYLRRRIGNPAAGAMQTSQQLRDASAERLSRLMKVKLFLEKNIDISREAGCRCMVSSRSDRLLFVSQKSSQNLFPGYGMRYIDLETMKPTNFVHVSAKQIRDLVVTEYPDGQPNFLLAATMESCGRLYDVTSKSHVQSFKPAANDHPEEQLWCCAFGQTDHLFFGGQRGTVFQFDKRQPVRQLQEIRSTGDSSPVINVAFVPAIPEVLPFGGILVCKLKELCFFQFLDPSLTTRQQIPVTIEGPFSFMSYENGMVLIMTRCGKIPSRYLVCRFERLPGTAHVALVVKHAFAGSEVMPVMSRPVLYHVSGTDSTLMTAYLQSTKMLTTWALENNLKLQSMAVADTILDLCPVYLSGVRHIAALTDTKCRVFKIHEERV